MQVTVLGYYGGYPYDGVGTSAYLVQSGDYHLLLDCGSGALLALEKVLDPLQLDAVLLSHYHHDHIADVGVLQYYWQLRAGERKEPVLPIYGHQADPINYGTLTWPGATVAKPYGPLKPTEIGPFSLECQLTKHPVPAYALRLTERATGQVLVFTADTAYYPDLTQIAQGADLLMADTNFPAGQTGQLGHLTTTQSGKLAKDARVKKLLLTHLPQTIKPEQLKAEAEQAAGPQVHVQVASQNLTIDLSK